MDLQVVLEQRAKVEEFQRKHRIGLLTLLFKMAKLPIMNFSQQGAVLKEFTELPLLKEFELKPPASVVEVPEPPVPSEAAQFDTQRQTESIISPEQQEEAEELRAAKSKLVMDFGLGQLAPERITIEVLKQLIRENPMKLSQAARIWLSPETPEAIE